MARRWRRAWRRMLYRPAGHGPFPVLLERTPYDKSAHEPHRAHGCPPPPPPLAAAEVRGPISLRHGYARRLSGLSGDGTNRGGPLYEIPERGRGRLRHPSPGWARQSWCNGRVGTFRPLLRGPHFRPHSAVLDPPGFLAAQFLDCGGCFPTAYRSGIPHGGAFDLKQATWALQQRAGRRPGTPAVKAALRRTGHQRVVSRGCHGARGDSPLSAAPEYEDYLFEQWSARHVRRFLESSRASMRKAITTVMADVPVVKPLRLVWYDPLWRGRRWRITSGLVAAEARARFS